MLSTGCALCRLTGIPHEQETPAPVTTTIRLLFASAVESEVRIRRVEESVAAMLGSRVTIILCERNGATK